MTTIQEIPVPGFEKVIEARNPSVGLTCFIAIHNTKLGPALGGTRIYDYQTKDQALTDVLRLSRGMTYKSAISKVGFGGGKAVIMGDPKKVKTEEVLLAYADVLNTLKGQFITAEDVGTTIDDLALMRKRSPFLVGLPLEQGGGDPSFFTAWGVFRGIEAVCMLIFGSPSVEGKKVVIQGLGKVGFQLGQHLFWKGADLIVTDLNSETTTLAKRLWGAKVVPSEEIHKVKCDIFSPSALGGILNKHTIPELDCKAVAGCANNQLLEEVDAERLKDRGILYAPDYIINAGGLINVSFELAPEGYDAKKSRDLVDGIGSTLLSVFMKADEEQISPQLAAVRLAEHYLERGIGKRLIPPYFKS